MNSTARKLLLSPQGIVRNGLIAEYRFHEGAGQVLYDYKNGNNGQLGSTTGADTNDPTWTPQGLTFATDDYVTAGTATDLNLANSNFTLVVAVKPTTTNLETVMAKNSFGPNGWGIYQDANKFHAQVRGSDAGAIINANSNYVLNQWYLLEFMRSGISLLLNINGVRQISTASITTEPSTAAVNFQWGKRATANDYYFNGEIAYALAYSRALSLGESARNYRALKKNLAGRGVAI